MQSQEFLYYLIDKDGNSYSVNPNDTIELDATPTNLPQTPDAWQDSEVHYARNPTYRGIFRSFSTPLKFVKAGARIIRELFYKNFIEFEVLLLILRKDMDTYVYQKLFMGELDFVNMVDNERFVECNVMEGGATKYLKANENTTYEIPIDTNPEAVDITMDGLELFERVNYSVVGQDVNYEFFTPNVPMINNEGQSTGVVIQSQYQDQISTVADYYNTSTNFILSPQDPLTVTITGRIVIYCTQNSSGRALKLYFRTSKGNIYDIYDSVTPFPVTSPFITVPLISTPPVIVNVSLTINLVAGERLFLGAVNYGSYSGGADLMKITFDESSRLAFNFVTKYHTTTIKALKPLTVLKALVQNMTGGACTVNSSLFTADDTVKLTSGDAVRGLSGTVLKTNFADFIRSYNIPYCIGAGQSDELTFVVEKKSYFYDKTTDISDLGDVINFKLEVNRDEIFNTMKIGWPDQTYDDVNGRAEFNITHQYNFPVTKVAKELNLVSTYRADMYGIEYTRINFEGKTTTDSSADNDVFMIKTEKNQRTDATYHLDRSLNPDVTGILTPTTAFNVALSPKRCLLANRDYISSLFVNMYGGMITFNTSAKAAVMRSNFGSMDGSLGFATEGDSVPLSIFTSPLYKPYMASFTCPVPRLLVDLMKATPNGYFSFTWNGGSYKGFLVDGGIKPGTNKEQDVRMLIHPDTDMNQLIN